MATIAEPVSGQSGLVRVIDRYIYVFMAAAFIAVTLMGFIPDSLAKIAAVEAGERPPFPLILHMHAVLMGSFLMLLLGQTTLAAQGRIDLHQKLGLAAFILAPAIVIVGFILVPTTYQSIWGAAQAAPPEAQEKLNQLLSRLNNIMLLQLRIGFLFPLFLIIALRARRRDSGLHKRMMILSVAMAMPASIDRIPWLPHTIPQSPISPDLYTLLLVSPMFLWDLYRARTVHRAYLIWLAINIPFAIAVHGLWGSAWWHANAPRLMGV